jgi:hypothetical protein
MLFCISAVPVFPLLWSGAGFGIALLIAALASGAVLAWLALRERQRRTRTWARVWHAPLGGSVRLGSRVLGDALAERFDLR